MDFRTPSDLLHPELHRARRIVRNPQGSPRKALRAACLYLAQNGDRLDAREGRDMLDMLEIAEIERLDSMREAARAAAIIGLTSASVVTLILYGIPLICAAIKLGGDALRGWL